MDTINWKWFRYDEIFEIRKGFYNKKPDDIVGGTIPFIGAIDSCNGITSYCDLDTIERSTKTGNGENASLNEKLFCGNCITVSNNGSVGYAFYQITKFTCTHDVNPLYLKGHALNPYIALFLCTLIEKERFRWTYGRKWRPKRMPDSLIKLPVRYDNTPDWDYIELYIKENIVPLLPSKVNAIWKGLYDISPKQKKGKNIESKTWKWFSYSELFTISGSKTTPKDVLEQFGPGEYPYVTTQANNNGVNSFYNYWTEEGGVLTIDSAVLGYCSYQEKRFSASDHVEILTPRFPMNKYVAIFLTTLINMEQYRYCYGRKRSQSKLYISKIKLPIDSEGTPDWQFMEDYIKSLPYSKNI